MPGSGRKDNRVKVGIIVAVVVVAVVAAIFVVLNRPWDSSAQPVAATYPVAVDGVVVTAGQPTAPVTIDVYEDFLCPFCERFETRNRDDLTAALNEGRVKVNFHALNILDARTTPPGYSTLAANAALCAVPAGIWPAYHERLFAEQPAEGSAGLTAAQLVGDRHGAGRRPGVHAVRRGQRQRRRDHRRHGGRRHEPGPADRRPVRHPDGRRRRPQDRRLATPTGCRPPSPAADHPAPVRGAGAGRVRLSSQGAVAQLVAHLTGSQRVRGSSPLSSTHSHQRKHSAGSIFVLAPTSLRDSGSERAASPAASPRGAAGAAQVV